jgi:hypothetical protein
VLPFFGCETVDACSSGGAALQEGSLTASFWYDETFRVFLAALAVGFGGFSFSGFVDSNAFKADSLGLLRRAMAPTMVPWWLPLTAG